jgi:tungstate transport system substrate-binding protein
MARHSLVFLVLALVGLTACRPDCPAPAEPEGSPAAPPAPATPTVAAPASQAAAPAASTRPLRLATTTSVDQTGLLASLLPPFEARLGQKVHVVAVGTGQALKLAENGDADAVLVHDPEAEAAFLAAGHGLAPFALAHNDFVLVGPAADPAGLRGLTDPAAALAKLAAAQATFISRGDHSGTHMKEMRLWKAAGVTPSGAWYIEAGQGQRQVLTMAHEKAGYALTDRSTWIAARKAVRLEVLVENPQELKNTYTFIPLSPRRHPDADLVGAMALAGWLASAEGQRLIGAFRLEGEQLFYPELEKAQ